MEMKYRGYKHKTPLDSVLAQGEGQQYEFVDTPDEQVGILRKKK